MKSKLIFTNPATTPPPRTNADVYAPPATPVLALTCLHILAGLAAGLFLLIRPMLDRKLS